MEKTLYNSIFAFGTKNNKATTETCLPKLSFCIIMDLIGLLSYAIPFWGEWTDVLWAPISGFIFLRTFGGKTGAVGGFINFIEELIPFTDFLPTFTIGYFYTRHKLKKNQ